jgi:hypothetical protein
MSIGEDFEQRTGPYRRRTTVFQDVNLFALFDLPLVLR